MTTEKRSGFTTPEQREDAHEALLTLRALARCAQRAGRPDLSRRLRRRAFELCEALWGKPE